MKNPLTKFKSLRLSMIIAFSSLILAVILFVSAMSINFTINNVRSTVVDYSEQLVEQVNSYLDSYINQMVNVANNLSRSGDVHNLIKGYSLSLSEWELNQRKEPVLSNIRKTASVNSDILTIAIIANNQEILLNRSIVNPVARYRQEDWYIQAYRNPDKPIISTAYVSNIIAGEYNWVVSISRAVIDSETKNTLGVILINFNYKVITRTCGNIKLGQDGYTFIVDEDGNIVYHPQAQLLYSGIKSEDIDAITKNDAHSFNTTAGGNKIYVVNRSDTTGWTLVGVSFSNELLSKNLVIIFYYVLIGLVAVFITIAAAIFISTSITRPMKILENDMREIEQGNLSIKTDVSYKNEIGQLSRTFNLMLNRINKLMQQTIDDQEQKRKSELKALQAQINPHFLYNTLDSIIWMAESGDTNEVVEITSALAKLFRSSISESEEAVPLSVELSNIDSYLIIQKMRYKNMFEYDIDIPEKMHSYLVLKLLLQPIVENAISHGLIPKHCLGHVRIYAEETETDFSIFVEDDGVGMSDEELKNIFRKKKSDGKGIGINNVNERIKLYYGAKYGLSYQSEKGKGTSVKIHLPIIRLEDQHEQKN